MVRQRASFDVVSPENGEVVVKQGRIFTKRALKQLADEGLTFIPISLEDLMDKAFARDIHDLDSDEVLFKAGEMIGEDTFEILEKNGISDFHILHVDSRSSDAMRKTLVSDKVHSREVALMDIYRGCARAIRRLLKWPRILSIICFSVRHTMICPKWAG